MKLFIAISLLVFAALPQVAIAQSAPASSWEVGAGYNYLHTNAPPAVCGCFSMNGGNASVAYHLRPSFGIVAQFQGLRNGDVNASGHDLTLLTYLAGPRYTYVSRTNRLAPFGEVLVGGSHASGGLYASSSVASSSTNSFAASMGGGLDLALTQHIALRVVQLDYLLTLQPNGVNSRQNNLGVSTGFVLHAGKR